MIQTELQRRGLATDLAVSALRDQAAAGIAEGELSGAIEADKARVMARVDRTAWRFES